MGHQPPLRCRVGFCYIVWNPSIVAAALNLTCLYQEMGQKTIKIEVLTTHRKDGEFFNPFLPYEEDLWVQHISDTHTLLLNKFNLVDHHVLVVTRKFEHQEEPLSVQDIDASLQVVKVRTIGALVI